MPIRRRRRRCAQIPYYERIPEEELEKPDDIAWQFGGWVKLRKIIKRYRLLVFARDITHKSAGRLMSIMAFLDSQDRESRIHLIVDSYGGHASAALGIVDIMQFLRAPTHTSCLGIAFSMAAMVVIAGRGGGRTMFPHSLMFIRRLQMKLPDVNEYDQSEPEMSWEDMCTHLRVMSQLEEYVLDTIATASGNTMEKIGEIMDENELLTAGLSVLKHGFVDQIGNFHTMNQIIDDTINKYRPSVNEIRQMEMLRELREEQEREEERQRYYDETEPGDSGGGDGGAQMEPA